MNITRLHACMHGQLCASTIHEFVLASSYFLSLLQLVQLIKVIMLRTFFFLQSAAGSDWLHWMEVASYLKLLLLLLLLRFMREEA